MLRNTMKMLVVATTAVVVIAPSALAAAKKTKPSNVQVQSRAQNFANAPASTRNRANAVYSNGRYLGSDPDPRIRSKLIQDRFDNADP